MASQGQAMIVVFDDLQWADQGSLLLMRHVAGSDLPMNLLVLATYRDTEITNSTPFVETLGALRRSRNMSRIDLAGLDSSGVLSLMEVAAGHALEGSATALADALHRETDGNPFFLSEVLRHLRDTGAIYEDAAGRWTSQAEFRDVPLPDSVREVIRARVVRLGADAERVLSLAAVIGRDFDLDLLARATQESPDVLLDVLEAAASVALVREMDDSAGQYSFSHALIQHTMYEHLSRTRRAQAHLVVGRALEDVCAGQPGARVGELARHWLIASQPVDVRKAIDYARQAAEAALSALAPDDALRYFSQALELCDQVGEPSIELRLRLGIGQGIAQRQTGDPAFRETLLGAARTAADLDDTELLVTAILANDRGTLSTLDSVDTEKIELLEIALDRVPEAHPHRALLLSTLCSELTMGSPLERRVSLGEQAAAIARRSGDDTTIVRVFNHIDLPLAVPSLLAESLARTAEALERAHLIGDPILLCASASARRFAAACAGDIQEMDRCFAVKDPLVEQLDQPFLNWVHALQRVTRALIAGDVDQAETWATTAFQIGNDGGQPDAFVIFGAQHITVSLFRGTMGDQIPLIMQAITANPGLDVFKAVLTLAHAEAGNEDEVRVLLDEFADSGFELPQDPTWLTGMIAYADAAVACSDPRHAGDLLERLAPFAEQWLYTDVTTSGPVSHSLGGLAALLGRFDDADAYFARAAADSERTAATYFAARTEISWGGMLLERNAVGDLDSGRGLVVNAREVASARGYQGLERRATEILQHGD
jgi:tetratricopeptide (TPR) repeat protein